MATEVIRIGVTMRIVHAQGYNELRDALSQDWSRFLNEVFPNLIWIPLPNLGAERIVHYCKQLGINRLVLSGGDDIGESDLRDNTELALLDWALLTDTPTLGICRGMQLMTVWAGTKLKTVDKHIRTRHALVGEMSQEVNSYHKLAPAKCPENFNIVVKSVDGSIEAIRHKQKRMEGWMWHPERETPAVITDIQRLQRLFA